MGHSQSNETSSKENQTSLYDYFIRLSVLGDYGTGKTSLINRFTSGTFPFIEIRTRCKFIGYFGRTLSVDDETVKVMFADTFICERFCGGLSSQHFRGAKGFLVVYDATSRILHLKNRELPVYHKSIESMVQDIKEYQNGLSFDNVEDWLKEIEKRVNEDVPIVLIGNKCDLHSKKVVTFTEAKEKADKLGIPLIETSACTDKNVEQAFVSLIVKSIQNIQDRKLQTNQKAEENKQTQNVLGAQG